MAKEKDQVTEIKVNNEKLAVDNVINAPPKLIRRNKYGLIEDSNIKYIFKEDGLVDWKAMVPKEFIVPNKQSFKGKEVPTSIEGLQDNQLLLMLGALKFLAQLRGIKDVNYTVVSPSENYVVATCSVTFIPNYETEGREVTFSSVGDAHPRNTSGFGANYLGAIAENRAFVRTIRNFLKIAIVSQEEIGGNITQETSNDDSATSLLRKTMEENKVSWDALKAKLISEKVDNAEKWNSINEIPAYYQFTLIQRIKSRAAEKAVK